jgi:hypothetical protein
MINYALVRTALLPLALTLLGSACRADLPPPADFVPDAPPAIDRVDGGTTMADQASPQPDAGPADLGTDGERVDVTAPLPEVGVDAGTEVIIEVPAGCGQQRPDVSQIQGADGLAIAPDGTIYYTQGAATAAGEGFVGRMRPGEAAEPRWLPIPLGAQLWGLALDEARQRLYVLAATSKSIHHVDVSQPGAAAGPLATLATGLESPNDIAVGPDGHVYYSAQTDRNIYRLSPTGARSMVTTSPTHARLAPSGVAFAPDGTLLVGNAGVGPILRLTLAGGVEQSRRPHGHLHTWANGMVEDSRGRLYVVTYSPTSEGRVLLITEDESTAIQVAAGASFGSLAFGRGALDCRDLYIAAPSGPLLRLTTDAAGW